MSERKRVINMLIIERIEDGIAVIEQEVGRIEVPCEMLAEGVREGDVVTLENGLYTADKAATEKRRREIAAVQDSLWDS